MTDKKLKPIIEYYDDGKIERAYSVDENGNKQGPYEEYWLNGRLKVKCTYKDDKKDGPYEMYCYDGQLLIKCTFKDDKKDGPYEAYWLNGRLKVKCTYKDGKELTGKEAEEYLQEWEIIHQPKKARKGLNARLAQMDKQMAPTQLRQAVKRAEVAKFRKSQPDKHAGRVIEKKNWFQKLFRGGR